MNKIYYFSTLALAILIILLKTESDTSRFSVAQSAILNANHHDLFQFVAHPDTVEMWFHWISHFRTADRKPLGIGKLYQAVYSLPIVGDYVMLFRVVKYVPDSWLVLESESLLKPRFEVVSLPVNGQQTRLTFRLAFRRSSTLFQYTVGPLLQCFAHYYIENSLAFFMEI